MTEIEIIQYYMKQEKKQHEGLVKDLEYLKQELAEREANYPVGHDLIESCKNRIEKKQYRIIEATDRFLALGRTLKTIKGEK